MHPFWAARFEQNPGAQKDSELPSHGDKAKNDSSNKQPNENAAQDTFDEDDTLLENEEGDHSEDNHTDASGTPTDEEHDDGDDDDNMAKGRNTIAERILGSKIFISVVSDAMAIARFPVKDEYVKKSVNFQVLRDALQRAITKAVELHGRERNRAKRRRASSSGVVGRRKSARPATDEDWRKVGGRIYLHAFDMEGLSSEAKMIVNFVTLRQKRQHSGSANFSMS